MKKRYVIKNECGYFLSTKSGKTHFNSVFKPEIAVKFDYEDVALECIKDLMASDKSHEFYSIQEVYIKSKKTERV